MADEYNPDEPPSDAIPPQLSGTANLIKNVSDYLAIEAEYDPQVAQGLMRKSLQDSGVVKTSGEIQIWAEVTQAILTHPVNFGRTHDEAKAKTDALANQMITASSRAPEATSSTINRPRYGEAEGNNAAESSSWSRSESLFDDPDDDFEDNEMIDEPEQHDSLPEIFGTENEEDAEEQAFDYILKLSERVED